MLFSRCFFVFNHTSTTEIYTLSLHDALPISILRLQHARWEFVGGLGAARRRAAQVADRALAAAGGWHRRCGAPHHSRSEEHTSELQSQSNLVCRLLLEKKKNIINIKLMNNYL